MNARERALDTFCFELDEYLAAVMEEQECSYDDAVDHAMGEYDEYWRALFEEELENENLTTGE